MFWLTFTAPSSGAKFKLSFRRQKIQRSTDLKEIKRKSIEFTIRKDVQNESLKTFLDLYEDYVDSHFRICLIFMIKSSLDLTWIKLSTKNQNLIVEFEIGIHYIFKIKFLIQSRASMAFWLMNQPRNEELARINEMHIRASCWPPARRSNDHLAIKRFHDQN